MLGKLLKYELKSTARMFGVIYLVILILAAAIGIASRTAARSAVESSVGPWRWDASGYGIVSGATAISLVAVYLLLLIVLAVITVVVVIQRFYKNLLGGEGYLMHTLPVPTWMHVASKLIAAVIWSALDLIVSCFSMFLLLLMSGAMAAYLRDFTGSLWKNFADGLITQELAIRIISFLIGVALCALFAYAAMAIGGSAKTHKKGFSLLTAVALLIACAVVTNRIGRIWDLSFTLNAADGLIAMIPEIIYCAVFFALTTVFLGKRLNLE